MAMPTSPARTVADDTRGHAARVRRRARSECRTRPPAGDRVAQDAVQPERRQAERQRRKGRGQRREQPLADERRVDLILDADHVGDERVGMRSPCTSRSQRAPAVGLGWSDATASVMRPIGVQRLPEGQEDEARRVVANVHVLGVAGRRRRSGRRPPLPKSRVSPIGDCARRSRPLAAASLTTATLTALVGVARP